MDDLANTADAAIWLETFGNYAVSFWKLGSFLPWSQV